MPSGITHILLTKKIQDKLSAGILKDILDAGSDFFAIGAVGPDLPYASLVDNDLMHNESLLADRFHYENTNLIALKSLEHLKSLKGNITDSSHQRTFSFFIGYISHIIADGIIHPFVRDMVGNYAENKNEHRSLEMQLDVLLLKHFTEKAGAPSQLNYTKFHDELLNFSQNEDSKFILDTFSNLIKDVYKEVYTPEQIHGWISGLHRLFDVAEGDHPRFYRALKENTFLFKNFEDIDPENILILKTPQDRAMNFLQVNQVHFFNDCLPQFYKKFIAVAEKSYEFVYKNGPKLTDSDIPPIDLDTGRLILKNDLNLIPVLWT